MQNKANLSPEDLAVREADFKARHVKFDKELKELCSKYEIRLEAEPYIFRGLLVARPSVSDGKKYEEEKSIEDKTPAKEGEAVDNVEKTIEDKTNEAKVDGDEGK